LARRFLAAGLDRGFDASLPVGALSRSGSLAGFTPSRISRMRAHPAGMLGNDDEHRGRDSERE
jgi:hypothetical protein